MSLWHTLNYTISVFEKHTDGFNGVIFTYIQSKKEKKKEREEK